MCYNSRSLSVLGLAAMVLCVISIGLIYAMRFLEWLEERSSSVHRQRKAGT